MSLFQRWFNNSSPLVKMLMAISITSAFVIGNKWVYAPYMKRKRHSKAEEWASYIIEQEEKVTESKESS